MGGSRARGPHPRRRARAGAAAPRPLQRLQRAGGGRRRASRLGVAPERIAAALGGMRAAFGRVETIEVAGKPVSILLIKNPAGANEVLRTLRLEAGGERDRPLDRPQRPDRRRPRRLLDLGRRLRAAGGRGPPGHLRRHAGAGDGAAAEVRGLAGGGDRGRAGDRGLARRAPSPRRPERLFALPTYTALLELRKLLAARGLAKEFWRVSGAAAAIWHDVECGAYDGDLALWEELAGAAGGPILDLGCGTGRVALHLARRGHRVHRASTSTRTLVAALNERGGGLPAGERRRRRRPRLRARTATFALVLAPMQLIQLLGERRRARRAACAASPRTCAPAGRLAVAIVERLPRADERGARRRCPTSARSTAGSTRACRSTPGRRRQRSSSAACARPSPRRRAERGGDEIRICDRSAPTTLEAEAARRGFVPAGRGARSPPTDVHVGSTVVLLERGA